MPFAIISFLPQFERSIATLHEGYNRRLWANTREPGLWSCIQENEALMKGGALKESEEVVNKQCMEGPLKQQNLHADTLETRTVLTP
ncbi:hypothetical protein cyc_00812 [Cyclospora cayetanensis]|uniref:Uncharacterized protein n=1 Tax=Cyclospora cayetanensis TaxID=88456 RepID=A0A1D3CRV3_9EIME|nr:hypothetical protein cyc_00812 [Cyclospora cayetanensis]